MKIVHLFTHDWGGAANSAYRLHRAMLQEGLDSCMVVGKKTRDDSTLFQVPGLLHKLSRKLGLKWQTWFARRLCGGSAPLWLPGNLPGLALRYAQKLRPDLIHLHWVRAGLISIEQIGRIPQPFVWTLHDLEPLSPGFCYRTDMQTEVRPFTPLMPVVGSHRRLAEHVWQRKLKNWRHCKLTVVGPSKWMAEEAKASPVFAAHKVVTIPYAVPVETFKPSIHRKALRKKFGIAPERRVLLFGTDTDFTGRKGGELLLAALQELASWRSDLTLVLFGGNDANAFRELSIPVITLGRIDDTSQLAEIYAAADIFTCPSREDNLPNAVLESLACGTPVAGFTIGGMPDMIQNTVNGFLAPPFDVSALARGIEDLLREPTDPIRLACREICLSKYSAKAIVPQYAAVFRDMLKSTHDNSIPQNFSRATG